MEYQKLPKLEDDVEDVAGEPREEEGDADQQNHHVRPLSAPLRLGVPTLRRYYSMNIFLPNQFPPTFDLKAWGQTVRTHRGTVAEPGRVRPRRGWGARTAGLSPPGCKFSCKNEGSILHNLLLSLCFNACLKISGLLSLQR